MNEKVICFLMKINGMYFLRYLTINDLILSKDGLIVTKKSIILTEIGIIQTEIVLIHTV